METPAKKGRPALPEDRRTVVTSIRLPPVLRAKLRRIGNSRLVEWLKRVKE